LGKNTHIHTHTQINIDMHFALCKATYDEGMWCHVLQRNNTHTQHNTISHLETNFHDMRDDWWLSLFFTICPKCMSSVKLPIPL
jgi:hypothetical protein